MSIARVGVMCLAGAVFLAGCGAPQPLPAGGRPDDPLTVERLGPAAEILSTAMESMGGLAAWSKVGRINAKAVVTMYDFDAVPYVNKQRQVFDLRGGTLAAEATSPRGTWHMVASTEGYCDLSVSGFIPDDERIVVIACTTATLLHRLRGPLNFFLTDERPESVEQTVFAGLDVVRVGVGGDNRWARAYYFDATTGMLRFVTSRGDGPYEFGTVTIYEYMMLPNGLAFPRSIRIVALGEHAMIGYQVLMEADFSDVVFR